MTLNNILVYIQGYTINLAIQVCIMDYVLSKKLFITFWYVIVYFITYT